MCKAVMELKQEGQREGEDIKAIELIQNAMNNTAKSFEEVCNMLGITTEDMNRYRKMIQPAVIYPYSHPYQNHNIS